MYPYFSFLLLRVSVFCHSNFFCARLSSADVEAIKLEKLRRKTNKELYTLRITCQHEKKTFRSFKAYTIALYYIFLFAGPRAISELNVFGEIFSHLLNSLIGRFFCQAQCLKLWEIFLPSTMLETLEDIFCQAQQSFKLLWRFFCQARS